MEDETCIQREARISAALSSQEDYVSVFPASDGVEKLLTVVGLVAFDKAPTIDVDYLAVFTALTPQHVETTNVLTERLADLGSIGFLAFAEMGNETGRR